MRSYKHQAIHCDRIHDETRIFYLAFDKAEFGRTVVNRRCDGFRIADAPDTALTGVWVGGPHQRKKTSARMPGSKGAVPSRSIITSKTSTSVARRAPRDPMRGKASDGASSMTVPPKSRPG